MTDPETTVAVETAELNGHHLIPRPGGKWRCTSCDLKGLLTDEPNVFAETCNPRRQSRKTRFHAWIDALHKHATDPKKEEETP